MSRYRRWNIGPILTADRVLIRAQQNEQIVIDQIWITNKDNSNYTVSLHHLPADDGAVLDNFSLIHEYTVNAKTYVVIDAKIYMEPGDKLVVLASGSDHVIVTAYGRAL